LNEPQRRKSGETWAPIYKPTVHVVVVVEPRVSGFRLNLDRIA
jgi:hypothetical protein